MSADTFTVPDTLGRGRGFVPGVANDEPGRPTIAVPAGTYTVDDRQGDDIIVIYRDRSVWLTPADWGMVPCPHCHGYGDESYLVGPDEWEHDDCGACEGVGYLTDAAAARLAREQVEAIDYWQAQEAATVLANVRADEWETEGDWT